MGQLTNGECGELVAKMHEIAPEDLLGWIVLAITSDGQSRVLTNGKNPEQVSATLHAAADRVLQEEPRPPTSGRSSKNSSTN
jgi:hypothetical protein